MRAVQRCEATSLMCAVARGTKAEYRVGVRRRQPGVYLPRPLAQELYRVAEAAVEIRNVAKRYANHVAVRDLSLTIPRGSVYGLLGPNGAGKTTTIRMVLNVIAPDAGTIAVLGRPAGDRAMMDRVGYLPEERGL